MSHHGDHGPAAHGAGADASATPLADRRCRPHEGGTALDAAQARTWLSHVDAGWRLADDARSIRREFRFPDFHRTMSFVNALAHVANVEDHHPDLELGYGHCRVTFSTHSVGGLSENDFVCAAKLDRLLP